MDDDSGPIGLRGLVIAALVVAMCAAFTLFLGGAGAQNIESQTPTHQSLSASMAQEFPPSVAIAMLLLIALSAYFSGSEVAFTSIHQVRLRGLREEGGFLGRMVANLMLHPRRLLTTVLIGNMIVNVLISVVLPPRLERVLEQAFSLPTWASYVLTVVCSTAILVFFGEVTPKVFAVRIAETFARIAVIPMQIVDWILRPVGWSAMKFTEFLFRITRLNEIQPAPFITDEEFISVLSDSTEKGVIEHEEGEMIQGIIESGDAYIREILVPRPDVIAIEQGATVGEARELFRKHEFTRMPVYEENLDRITGVVVAKDLLPSVVAGDTDAKIGTLARRPSFVPETMTIRAFMKDAQRKRMHLSIVVDEYGGTEGIATLHDAIEEVVGDIREEEEEVQQPYTDLGNGSFEVEGGFPLDDLEELIAVQLDESEHETVAGFFIEHSNKVPEKGDTLVHEGVIFTVEEVDGKRASRLRVEVYESANHGKGHRA